MPQKVQGINVVRTPQSLIQGVTVSNMMDYSLRRHSRVMNGKLHNPPLNVCRLQPKPTGKSQGCHSSHYKPQKAIKLSPTLVVLEQYTFANLPACTGCDPLGHLKDSPALICVRITVSYLCTACVSATLLQKYWWALQQLTATSITCRAESWNIWRSNNKSATVLGGEPGS